MYSQDLLVILVSASKYHRGSKRRRLITLWSRRPGTEANALAWAGNKGIGLEMGCFGSTSVLDGQDKPDLLENFGLLDRPFDLVWSKDFGRLRSLRRLGSIGCHRDLGWGTRDLENLRCLGWASGLGRLGRLHGLKGLGWRRGLHLLRWFCWLGRFDGAGDLGSPRRRGWLR